MNFSFCIRIIDIRDDVLYLDDLQVELDRITEEYHKALEETEEMKLKFSEEHSELMTIVLEKKIQNFNKSDLLHRVVDAITTLNEKITMCDLVIYTL